MSIYEENRHKHFVGWNTWHFQWVTKYRYNIFRNEYLKNICVVAIEEAAKRAKIEIIDMEVDINHVHAIANIPMTIGPTKAVQLLKGFSARVIFQLVPNLRKQYPRGHLWSPGKFAASVGHITLEKAKNYLEAHHAKALDVSVRESSLRSEAEELPSRATL